MRAHQLTPTRYLERVRLRHRLDEKARAAGYPDVPDLFRHTMLHSRDSVAAMLGVSRRHLVNLHSYFPDLPRPRLTDDQGVRFRRLAAVRAQSGKRQRAYEAYDQLARQCGYAGITEMIRDTRQLTYRQVAALLGVPPHRVQFLRIRYGSAAQTRSAEGPLRS